MHMHTCVCTRVHTWCTCMYELHVLLFHSLRVQGICPWSEYGVRMECYCSCPCPVWWSVLSLVSAINNCVEYTSSKIFDFFYQFTRLQKHPHPFEDPQFGPFALLLKSCWLALPVQYFGTVELGIFTIFEPQMNPGLAFWGYCQLWELLGILHKAVLPFAFPE